MEDGAALNRSFVCASRSVDVILSPKFYMNWPQGGAVMNELTVLLIFEVASGLKSESGDYTVYQ